jgi:acetyltransferase-like isoleucine patch superfamily enzyme
MEFGTMSNLTDFFKYIIKNPLTIYLRFLLNWSHNQFTFKQFKQGYLSLVLKSNIEPNVCVESNALVLGSSLGAFTYVSMKTLILQAFIGKFCSIGPNCLLGWGIHPSQDFVSTHPIFYSTKAQAGITFADRDYFEERKPIKIGNDVFIGANVIVLDGVTIGDGAIIAAGAVVTKNVPPYSIYGGVPAKLIRYRFEQETIEFLVNFQWWNKDQEWLKNNFKYFHNINKFFKEFANSR